MTLDVEMRVDDAVFNGSVIRDPRRSFRHENDSERNLGGQKKDRELERTFSKSKSHC